MLNTDASLLMSLLVVSVPYIWNESSSVERFESSSVRDVNGPKP